MRKIILLIFALAFAVMIYGVAVLGWWMAEISAVFLASAIIVGLIARMSEEELTSTFERRKNIRVRDRATLFNLAMASTATRCARA